MGHGPYKTIDLEGERDYFYGGYEEKGGQFTAGEENGLKNGLGSNDEKNTAEIRCTH